MAPRFRLPESALSEQFLAGSGPGGQNANKVATAVQLQIDLRRLGLGDAVLVRLRQLAGSRVTQDDRLIIIARSHRTQDANRAEARRRAQALIHAALVRPRLRLATAPSLAARTRRLDAKRKRGQIKAARSAPAPD